MRSYGDNNDLKFLNQVSRKLANTPRSIRVNSTEYVAYVAEICCKKVVFKTLEEHFKLSSFHQSRLFSEVPEKRIQLWFRHVVVF